ncbi:Oxidoreductase, NAD-binding domain protein [Leptospira interrogans serovar Canicola]|nr:Oxidoreductase, NAD-binding domain protein [Leptospira interrogans serovar Canicola]
MTERVKLGVIGTGHMGQYHVNVAKTLNDATLVGIYDSDLERAKQIAEKHKNSSILYNRRINFKNRCGCNCSSYFFAS